MINVTQMQMFSISVRMYLIKCIRLHTHIQVIPGNVEEYTILFTCTQFPHIFVRIFHLLTRCPGAHPRILDLIWLSVQGMKKPQNPGCKYTLWKSMSRIADNFVLEVLDLLYLLVWNKKKLFPPQTNPGWIKLKDGISRYWWPVYHHWPRRIVFH